MRDEEDLTRPSHGRCLVIAETGVNHNGDVELARALVETAAKAGADAVKMQTFVAERVAGRAAPKAAYQIETTGGEESQLEMLKRLELSPEAHEELQALCRKLGVLFVSTPFDRESVDLLDRLDVPFLKIGSGEVTNLPFLAYAASKGRPVVLSTGMSNLAEVDDAVRTLEQAGCENLTLLHCVSNYPADPADVNLRAMTTMARAWGHPVGYSDHTPGLAVALAAVAMGAVVLEKHFTLDRDLPGPDQRASLEPSEFREMVDGIRTIEKAMGSGRKTPAPSEANTRAVARRSLVAARDIEPGDILSLEDLAILRPGTGLPPAMLPYVAGRVARRAIEAGAVIDLEMIT
jgi:N,N'-diacetyllegionaminate synthase